MRPAQRLRCSLSPERSEDKAHVGFPTINCAKMGTYLRLNRHLSHPRLGESQSGWVPASFESSSPTSFNFVPALSCPAQLLTRVLDGTTSASELAGCPGELNHIVRRK